MTEAIIFDFDGTLVDSEKAIYRCFLSVTKKIALDRINYAKRILIGPPLRDTASSILGPNHQDQLDEFVEQFIQMHDNHAIFHTNPYFGVNKLLQKLALMNVPMAIATNKREVPTIKLIEHFSWEKYFHFIECHDNYAHTRTKAKMIKDIINSNNIFKNCYFVGDTVNDGLSANINKLSFIRANYGYGQNQDWSKVIINNSVESAEELESIIK